MSNDGRFVAYVSRDRGVYVYLRDTGETKRLAGEQLKKMPGLSHFDQLVSLLQVFYLLAESNETEPLRAQPIASASVIKEQQRLQKVYHFIETNYQNDVDVNRVAEMCHMTTAAFCRYFKKLTHYTFTDFLNHYRISQSKKLLLQNKTVTAVCYETGFGNMSYFNKAFKKITGENPSSFRKKHVIENI